MVKKYGASFAILVLAGISLPASAADRMRPGQWVGTTVVGARTFPSSSCISNADAAAMNGDAGSIKSYLETIIPPSICKIADVKAVGNQIVYTAICADQPPRIVTTSYHGDSSEGSDTIGTKTQAKLTGPCSK